MFLRWLAHTCAVWAAPSPETWWMSDLTPWLLVAEGISQTFRRCVPRCSGCTFDAVWRFEVCSKQHTQKKANHIYVDEKVSDCANLSRKKYENNAILRDSSLLSSSSLFSALLFPSQVYCALYSSLFYRPLFHSSLLHSTLLHSALLHSTLTHLFSTQPIPSLVSISWLLSALSLDFLLVCDTESRLLNFFWTWHGPDIELALAARLLSGCC
jgi:hypothetical protein